MTSRFALFRSSASSPLANSEFPEFIGRAVAALAAASVAAEYEFTDIDGSAPRSLTLAHV